MRGYVKDNSLGDQAGLTMKKMASLVHTLTGAAATAVTIAVTVCRVIPDSTCQTRQLRL